MKGERLALCLPNLLANQRPKLRAAGGWKDPDQRSSADQQTTLGKKQAALGDQQAELGNTMSVLSAEIEKKLAAMIDDFVRRGVATTVSE